MSEDFFAKRDELLKPEIMLCIVGTPGANVEVGATKARIVDVINGRKQGELVLVDSPKLL